MRFLSIIVVHLVLVIWFCFCCLNLESVVHVISITCCSALGVGHVVLFLLSQLGVSGACDFYHFL